MVSSMERFHCIQDSQLGPNGVHCREVPLYTGQLAGSQWCPLWRGSTVYKTASWVPMVSSIESFHCIQDSQLGPNGVLYREVPLHLLWHCGCSYYRVRTCVDTVHLMPCMFSRIFLNRPVDLHSHTGLGGCLVSTVAWYCCNSVCL